MKTLALMKSFNFFHNYVLYASVNFFQKLFQKKLLNLVIVERYKISDYASATALKTQLN